MIIRDVTLPLRLVTLENQREHWAKKAKRAKLQRAQTRFHLLAQKPHYISADDGAAYVAELTRLAPRRLDSGNYQGCFKHVQDGVADWLGIDDGDPRIEWRYAQERGKPKEYAVRIRIERKSA